MEEKALCVEAWRWPCVATLEGLRYWFDQSDKDSDPVVTSRVALLLKEHSKDDWSIKNYSSKNLSYEYMSVDFFSVYSRFVMNIQVLNQDMTDEQLKNELQSMSSLFKGEAFWHIAFSPNLEAFKDRVCSLYKDSAKTEIYTAMTLDFSNSASKSQYESHLDSNSNHISTNFLSSEDEALKYLDSVEKNFEMAHHEAYEAAHLLSEAYDKQAGEKRREWRLVGRVGENKEVAGTGYLVILERGEERWGCIFEITCYPQYRGKGVATQVMRALIEHGRSLGLTKFLLKASTMGKPVYAKLGFIDHGPIYYVHFQK